MGCVNWNKAVHNPSLNDEKNNVFCLSYQSHVTVSLRQETSASTVTRQLG